MSEPEGLVLSALASRLWEDGFDREQVAHLLRLEDTALRIDKRNAITPEPKPWPQLVSRQVIIYLTQFPYVFESCHAHIGVDVVFQSSASPLI